TARSWRRCLRSSACGYASHAAVHHAYAARGRRTVVKLFTAPEIAPWPLPEGVHSTVQRHAVFSPADARWEDRSAAWLDLLHRRIVQHVRGRMWRCLLCRALMLLLLLLLLLLRAHIQNIRVIAKYYARLRTARLAGLLGLTEEQTERELAEMVSGQQKLFARVDRPAGIVTFTRPKPAEEILSDWSSDIGEILALVERTDHLINKERMMMEAAARAR
ncbi:MAG: PCI domain-containing protein, partial [Allorhizobium sp.]